VHFPGLSWTINKGKGKVHLYSTTIAAYDPSAAQSSQIEPGYSLGIWTVTIQLYVALVCHFNGHPCNPWIAGLQGLDIISTTT